MTYLRWKLGCKKAWNGETREQTFFKSQSRCFEMSSSNVYHSVAMKILLPLSFGSQFSMQIFRHDHSWNDGPSWHKRRGINAVASQQLQNHWYSFDAYYNTIIIAYLTLPHHNVDVQSTKGNNWSSDVAKGKHWHGLWIVVMKQSTHFKDQSSNKTLTLILLQVKQSKGGCQNYIIIQFQANEWICCIYEEN